MALSQLFMVGILLQLASFAAPTYESSKTYIVYMGNKPENVHSLLLTKSHHSILASVLGSHEAAKESLVYSYSNSMNGFSAVLTADQASILADTPGVVSVFESKTFEPQTTNSMAFLGLENAYGNAPSNSLWKKAKGQDIIIGVIDSGIWPESASFRDNTLGPVPSKWKGICQTGGTFTSANCNRKLIGARYYSKSVVLQPKEEYSPRDITGHGTHVSSIAAGSYVTGVSSHGFASGTAKGAAPNARIAAYKVCWIKDLCDEARVLAALDQAILDGVDVINLSLGSKLGQFYSILNDGIALGALHAVMKGIHVVAAGGNDGPGSKTISNIAPWFITVAASTIDREFRSDVVLGNNQVLPGWSLSTSKSSGTRPLVLGKDISTGNVTASILCEPGSLEPYYAKGRIIFCEPGGDASDKVVRDVGGAGMIFANNKPVELRFATEYSIPASHVGFNVGNQIRAYIQSSSNPVANIVDATTLLGYRPAPVMASFSSVGPNDAVPDLLKPDITAPGVYILAAWSAANSSDPYKFASGTSMASPHVAGIVALLRQIYPKWSPAAVRSALMTTAYTVDNVRGTLLDGLATNPGGPFNFGNGHVSPNAASDPGLIYDATVSDYAAVLCSMGYSSYIVQQITGVQVSSCVKGSASSLNYPSVTLSNLKGTTTVSRTVTHVGSVAATYRFQVNNPSGLVVTASPSVLSFLKAGESKTFTLTLKATKVSSGYVFGDFTWSDGQHKVSSPIVAQVTSTLNMAVDDM